MSEAAEVDAPLSGEFTEGMTPEQAADLAALAQSIADEPMPGEVEAPGTAEVDAPSQVAEISGIVFTVGQIAGMRFASLKTIYTQKRCDEVAEAVAPVFADLGWNVSGGKAGMYLTAAIALFMLGNDTREAIKAELTEAAKPEAEPGAN